MVIQTTVRHIEGLNERGLRGGGGEAGGGKEGEEKKGEEKEGGREESKQAIDCSSLVLLSGAAVSCVQLVEERPTFFSILPMASQARLLIFGLKARQSRHTHS